MFPSEWWRKAEPRLIDPQRARQSLEELLKRHPDPQSLIDYLNERRFILLLELLDRSECIRKFLINHPEDFQNTIPGLWYKSKEKRDYLKELSALLVDTMSDEKFSEKLAYYRHRELMRILSKEYLGTAPLEDLLREYSNLPDAMLELAYERALKEYQDRYSKPMHKDGSPAGGLIIALGKLGSYELNYYSDIDIMFVHSSDEGYAGKLELKEFFSKVFQKTLSLMSTITPEGKPYEVDLDLRPFGRSGPISMSLRSMELYYESYGRTWERFALLRSRFCAGDEELYHAFEREVKMPFVFRKTVDYRILEEIRMMKNQISAQAKRSMGDKVNVKTGEGGIREVEFAVQSLVLLLGGKIPFLRESNTFRAIWRLNKRGIFSDEEAKTLERAYEFLRRLEHAIQMGKCIQTQSFSQKDIGVLAKVLQLEEKELTTLYKHHTEQVSIIFNSIMPSQEEEELHPIQQAIISEDRAYGVEVFKSYNFKNPGRAFDIFLSYLQGREGINLSSSEKRSFIKLLPKIVEYMSSSNDPDETLTNFDKFFSNPTGRKVILSQAREDVNRLLCKVFSLSSYLSTLISRYPDLVEDVLTLYQDFPSVDMLREEFERYKTLSLTAENLFRRFKRVWEVRIALIYLLKREDRYQKLMSFFESLTLLADFLMEELWKHMGFEKALLIAMGKYGSKELSIGSDLDLVFCGRFSSYELTKKAQDFVRFITTHTSEGYLYKVDFRLRPMGTKGELLPSLDFYREYFERYARTWERIAWTRCRYVFGDKDLEDEFEGLLRDFLFSRPLRKQEKEEIRTMREKLEGLAKKGKDIIDLKFAPGGLIDAEFITQYFILLEGLREPSMIRALGELSQKHPLLGQVYRDYMFLRLVETRLRLSRESGGSVMSRLDAGALASSLGMEGDEFWDEVKHSMRRLRDAFSEIFS